MAEKNNPDFDNVTIRGNLLDENGNAIDVTATAGVTAGTVTASKVVIVDANKDVSGFRNIGATGTATVGAVVGADAALNITGIAGSGGAGGTVPIAGGAGDTDAAGGAVSLTGGAGNGTGNGATATVAGGASGAGATGDGGAVNVNGGAASSTNGAGGALAFGAGNGAGTGAGGAVTITSGASAGAGGTAGAVSIDTGAATGGTGASITLGGTNALNVILGCKLELQKLGSAASSASGLLMGVGTSADPATTSTADGKMVEIRAQTTATSGDNRLAYLRYDINGAGASGECLRAFTDLTAAAGSSAHGAHVSLQVSDTGYVSGLGAGFRGQLYVKDAAVAAGGTYYGTLAEVYCAGASSDISAVTAHAILGVIASGNATGVGTVLNAMAFAGSTGTGKMIYNNDSTGATESNGSIRILVDEGAGYVARYLRYWDAENS